MAIVKLGIVDDNKPLCDLLYEYFLAQPDFVVEIIAHNGYDVLKGLERPGLEIDVLLLDMIMPGLDGFTLLKHLQNQKDFKRFKIVVFSGFLEDELMKKMADFHVDYYIIKPFNLEILGRRLRQIVLSPANVYQRVSTKDYQNNFNKEILEEITKIIQSIKIPTHFKGFSYLRDAIFLTIIKPELLNEITNKLYPLIGASYQSNEKRVERAMRFAIETAWNKANLDVLNNLFGYCVDDNKGKPTNALFIAKIADLVRLKMKYRVRVS